jgi:hypothetical protein
VPICAGRDDLTELEDERRLEDELPAPRALERGEDDRRLCEDELAFEPLLPPPEPPLFDEEEAFLPPELPPPLPPFAAVGTAKASAKTRATKIAGRRYR